MHMKRFICLLLVCAMLLCGCGASAGDNETSGLKELDVVLDWYPNALHAFLYVAIEKGYYEEEGLKVNIRFPSNANDAISLVAAGQADIGLYYQQDVIQARAQQDVPVKSIGAVVQGPLNIVLSLKEKGITSAGDLVGKTIGYAGTELSEALIRSIMQYVGADYSDVTMIDVGFDLMSSMTTGNVDATYGCFINHEIPALEEEGFPMDYMKLTDYGVPNYYALMLVTGEGQLEKNRDKYTRFLRACEKGFDDMQADPDGALQLMMNNQNTENFPLTESVEKKSFDVLLPIMEKEGTPFLSQDAAVWQENIDWLYSTGMIESTFDPAEVMVDLLGE